VPTAKVVGPTGKVAVAVAVAVLSSQKVRPSEAWHTMDAHAFAQLYLVEGRRYI
jgi:hypothetical protein